MGIVTKLIKVIIAMTMTMMVEVAMITAMPKVKRAL